MTRAIRTVASAVLTTIVLGGLAIVLLAMNPGAPADAITPARQGLAATTADQPLPSAGSAAELIDVKDALSGMGMNCWRIFDAQYAMPTATDLGALDGRVSAAGITEGWLVAEAGPWDKGQLRIGGTASEVAAAYGGELYADGWILTERNGGPYAFSVEAVNLPSGAVAWQRRDSLIPLDPCPSK